MKINGQRHYLWFAVDHEGEVLESYVTKKRDNKAALNFMEKLYNIMGLPMRSLRISTLLGVWQITQRRINIFSFDDEKGQASIQAHA